MRSKFKLNLYIRIFKRSRQICIVQNQQKRRQKEVSIQVDPMAKVVFAPFAIRVHLQSVGIYSSYSHDRAAYRSHAARVRQRQFEVFQSVNLQCK